LIILEYTILICNTIDFIGHLNGSLLLKFYLSLVTESLQDVQYDAEMADLDFNINFEGGEGIVLYFGGFNQKLDKLAYVVFERLLNPIWDQTIFDRTKQLVCVTLFLTYRN
jgi:secreted Zn-dependent insulinase-like peptidase